MRERPGRGRNGQLPFPSGSPRPRARGRDRGCGQPCPQDKTGTWAPWDRSADSLPVHRPSLTRAGTVHQPVHLAHLPAPPALPVQPQLRRRHPSFSRHGCPGAPALDDPDPRQRGPVQGGRHQRLHQDGQCPALGLLQDPGHRPPLPDGTGRLWGVGQVLFRRGRAVLIHAKPKELQARPSDCPRGPRTHHQRFLWGRGARHRGDPSRLVPELSAARPFVPSLEPGSVGRGEVTGEAGAVTFPAQLS